MKRENILLLIIAAVLLTTASFWFWNGKIGVFENQPAGMILFYGDGCSHCKNVDDFIKNNKVQDRIEFTQLEVFNNADNKKIFTQKAIICQIPEKDWGVPLLWDGQTCIAGDQDIIKFFQDTINSSK